MKPTPCFGEVKKKIGGAGGGMGKGPAYRQLGKSPYIKYEVTPTILHMRIEHAMLVTN